MTFECSAASFKDLSKVAPGIMPNCPLLQATANGQLNGVINPSRPGGNFFTAKEQVLNGGGYPCQSCNLGTLNSPRDNLKIPPMGYNMNLGQPYPEFP